jgi:hypothetical protein
MVARHLFFSSLIDFSPYWGLIGLDFGFLVLSTAQASIKLACEKIPQRPFFGIFFELLTGSGFRNIFFKPPIRKINVSFWPFLVPARPGCVEASKFKYVKIKKLILQG